MSPTPPCWPRCCAKHRSVSPSSAPTCGSAGSTTAWPGCTAATGSDHLGRSRPRSGPSRWPPAPSPRSARCWLMISHCSSLTSRVGGAARTAAAGRDSLDRAAAPLAPIPGGAAGPALGVLLVPLARPRGRHHRRRPDRRGRHRAAQRRGGGPPQRGALPLAGAGGCTGRLGYHADWPDRGGFPGVALDHRPEPGGVPGQRLDGRDAPRGPGTGRAGLAGLHPGRQGLRQPLPGPHQDRLVPAL